MMIGRLRGWWRRRRNLAAAQDRGEIFIEVIAYDLDGKRYGGTATVPPESAARTAEEVGSAMGAFIAEEASEQGGRFR